MKFILLSIGTRGDMEPFIAIGDILCKKGHEVICMFPEQFGQLCNGTGIRFVSLGRKFIDIVDSEDGRIAMGGGGSFFRKMRAYFRLYKQSISVNKEMISIQRKIIEQENPDRILYNGKAVYPSIWSVNNPNKSSIVSAIPYYIHYVKDHPSIGFKGNYGAFFNKMTYSLSNFGMIQNIISTTKKYRKQPKITGKQIKKAFLKERMIYTISPSIFQRPKYWPDNVQILGYHQRDNKMVWKAEDTLTEFLTNHDKILLLTFGSMINPNPAQSTNRLLDTLEKLNIPTIVNVASGGLIKPDKYNSNLFYFVSQIPYDWLLPKIYGVIHHGGSGTTHMALKHGCASMIIPHIFDQYIWNEFLNNLGAGPQGLAIDKLHKKSLEDKIMDLWSNKSYKENSLRISERMASEEILSEKLYETIIE